MNPGDTVVINCPWDGRDGDGDTWLKGAIEKTIAEAPGYAVHIVKVTAFKWGRADMWGAYDGVPTVLAREERSQSILQWVDTWPRRL